MRVVVTGTPGTGKTTATDLLDVPVVHLNDVIRSEGLWTERDTARDSLVTDIDAVAAWVDEQVTDDPVVVESHLAHYLDADRVVVLRCDPTVLERRLRDRGESDAKVRENAESEALDVVLAEAVERHGESAVYEIDATDRTPEQVADAIDDVVAGRRDPAVGTVNFIDYL